MTTDLIACNPDVVHLHGLWQYPSLATLRWFRKTRKNYAVSPHGMLEPWSLQQSRPLKRLALWLYQGPCLRSAFCIRATARMEADSIRRAGFRNPIALIPNGVEVPQVLPARSSPQTASTRQALFLSRIHPKKGLANLVQAWHDLQPSGWHLTIVGPDEGGHLAEIKRLAAGLGLQDKIRFIGETFGDAKLKLYTESDLFVLPTYSENFGTVIAEAMSCGVPVITTRGTPWEELQTLRCGWWIEIGLEPLKAALKEAFALPPQRLQEMGGRARKLVQDRYAWAPIGRQMVEVYEWMLGRRPRPGCVMTDL